MKKPNLIIAQGGGLRMIEAMAGMLKAIDEMGFNIGEYRGASAGGIMCALYASGHGADQIIWIIKGTDESDLMSLSWWQMFKLIIPGVKVDYLYNRDGMRRFLDNLINEEMSKLKVTVSLTNAKTGESFLHPGSIDALMGTSAIPEVFEPYKVDGILCTDGGEKNNIPMIKIKDIQSYNHIFILLCNKTKSEGKSTAWSKTGRALEAIESTMDREVNQVYEEGWDKLANCTVIQPPPFDSDMMSWSRKHMLIDHAYNFTWQLLKRKFK